MAKGDVAVSMTLPAATDNAIERMAREAKTTRREIVIRAVKLLDAPVRSPKTTGKHADGKENGTNQITKSQGR